MERVLPQNFLFAKYFLLWKFRGRRDLPAPGLNPRNFFRLFVCNVFLLGNVRSRFCGDRDLPFFFGFVNLPPGSVLNLRPGTVFNLRSGRVLSLRPGAVFNLRPGRVLSLRPGTVFNLRPGRVLSLRVAFKLLLPDRFLGVRRATL